MADTKRRKTVSTSFNDDGTMSLSLYTSPDGMGVQGIAETITFDPAEINEKLETAFLCRGVSATFVNVYGRLDNPSASDLRKAWDAFLVQVKDGSFVFGRTFESEPDDLILAAAEASGQPVHVVQQKIDDLLAQCVMENGAPKRDKANRVVHVWGKAKLYKAIEDGTPGLKAVMARLVAERARRLAAEAKSHKPATTAPDLLGFGAPQAAAAA